MKIELPPLPFPMDALEPLISRKTLEFHYGKHHKAYVDKTNDLIEGTEYQKLGDLEDIIRLAKEKNNKELFNNAAQALNHEFYWNCLTNSTDGPSKDMENLLIQSFGSVEEFKIRFTTIAKKLFGSGWAWLTKDEGNGLKILATPNAGNPLVEGQAPLLACDVWEHAYYLDYQNARPQYLESFWKLVNWDFVEANLEKKVPLFRPTSQTIEIERPNHMH